MMMTTTTTTRMMLTLMLMWEAEIEVRAVAAHEVCVAASVSGVEEAGCANGAGEGEYRQYSP